MRKSITKGKWGGGKGRWGGKGRRNKEVEREMGRRRRKAKWTGSLEGNRA